MEKANINGKIKIKISLSLITISWKHVWSVEVKLYAF